MASTYELYHGSPATGIIGIMKEGKMRPDATHHLFFSERFEDALQHGADTTRKASFASKAQITIVDGAAVERAAKPGNPLAVAVTTVLPVPLRKLHAEQTRAFLFRPKWPFDVLFNDFAFCGNSPNWIFATEPQGHYVPLIPARPAGTRLR